MSAPRDHETHGPGACPTERLSEYLDGGLDAAERVAIEAHVAGCDACTRTLAGLRGVMERAATLGPVEPPQDLWPGIAARLERRAPAPAPLALPARGWRTTRWSLSLPQLAAAAAVVAVLSSAGVWLALTHRAVAPPGARGPVALAPSPARAPGVAAEPATFETARYDAAIADLERVLREHRSELDTSTVRVIEQNLQVIDLATAQARRALAADPANPYLTGHLATQLRRKMTLLRTATSLIAYGGPETRP